MTLRSIKIYVAISRDWRISHRNVQQAIDELIAPGNEH
jgi:hypothetical protein